MTRVTRRLSLAWEDDGSAAVLVAGETVVFLDDATAISLADALQACGGLEAEVDVLEPVAP